MPTSVLTTTAMPIVCRTPKRGRTDEAGEERPGDERRGCHRVEPREAPGEVVGAADEELREDGERAAHEETGQDDDEEGERNADGVEVVLTSPIWRAAPT